MGWTLALSAAAFGLCAPVMPASASTQSPQYDGCPGSLGSGSTPPRTPDQVLLHTELAAPDGAANEAFGYSVAVDGDTMVIGAPFHRRTDPGVGYVFVRSGDAWVLQAELVAADGQSYDELGISAAISGDTVVLGAPDDDTPPGGRDAGSAYVFVRSGTTWTQEAKLKAPDGGRFFGFGYSVAIDGDTILVGEVSAETPAGEDAGAAYVFVRSGATWKGQAKLTPLEETGGAEFGRSVALQGDTALIGANFGQAPGGPRESGLAYAFVRADDTWTEQAMLVAPDAQAGDSFGLSVALDAETAVIGAAFDDPYGDASGSAYVFVRDGSTWTAQTKLLAPDGAIHDELGWSVAVHDDIAVIGSNCSDTVGGSNAGAAYMFRRSGSTWTPGPKLLARDGAAGDWFGRPLAFDGSTLVISANEHDTPAGENAGAVYLRWAPQPGRDWVVANTSRYADIESLTR